jgi:formate-dependent nitrite reductase membrane component NrfD
MTTHDGPAATGGDGPVAAASGQDTPTGGGRRRSRRRRGEELMVPPAEFVSYYGRPIVKASPWEADIPAYLFLGGVAGGSSLLAAGSDLTGRAGLRRSSRITAISAVTISFAALVHDLGKPSRFHHMLRVAKITSPMSVGTWILTAYAPLAGLAAVSEARGRGPLRSGPLAAVIGPSGRAAGLAAAVLAPALASYTAVLLADTATPSWHEGRHHLPFTFVGSAAAAAGGMGMVAAPRREAAPARLLAVGGALLELASTLRMESQIGITAEPLHEGRAGRYMVAAKALTGSGALLTVLAGRRSRTVAVVAGAALLGGSACTRFGIFHAGQQSARDPRYTVVPQRARLDAGRP